MATDREMSQQWARKLLEEGQFVVLDTETTGLDGGAEVVQIAIVAPSGQVLLDTLVRPQRPIPPGATRIHGITDAMVATAPTFAEIAPQLREQLCGLTVVIYNAAYDERVMEQSARACQLTHEVPIFGAYKYDCAMEPYAAYVGDWSDYHHSYRYQKPPAGDHSALGDAQACLALIKRMAGVPNAEIAVKAMDEELRGYETHYGKFYVDGRYNDPQDSPLADALSAFVADLVGAYSTRAGSQERQHIAHAYLEHWRRDQGWTPGLPNAATFLVARLSPTERELLALALQGLAMRQGPPSFAMLTALAQKLGVQEQLEAKLKDYITTITTAPE